ncbi:hypothetical protein DID88_008428 [Monilinia fructigena]|uniref:Uncharacterized protein n=1 Tax=Monilinia fructigena TaxID=38457 RepID=A0A395J5D7_9HELO|nr:hypothetical protein DID88_008428 [Monilinia fructigena]
MGKRGTRLDLSRFGRIQRKSSSYLTSQHWNWLLPIQPVPIPRTLEVYCETLKKLDIMSFDIDKKKLGQDQKQKQAYGKDKFNDYLLDIGGSNTLVYKMVSMKESVDDSAIDVDFGVDNVPSRYASGMRMRSGSPAISEASSCTLAEDGSEAEPDSNRTLPSSTILRTQAYSSPLSESPSTPATPVTPAQKRRREDDTSNSEEEPPVFKLPDGAVLIDLEDYEGEARLEEEIFGIEPQVISQDSIKRALPAQRNPEILPPNVEIASIPWKNSVLRPGKTIELKNGTFIKIKVIVKNLTTDDVAIRGWKLVRTREFVLGGMVQKKRNEVAFVHEIDRDDRRDVWEQSVDTVRLEDFIRIRRLVCTNRPLPECRYSKNDIPSEIGSKENKEKIKYITEEMVLVARWAFVVRYANAEARVRKGSLVDRPRYSAVLRSLKKEECRMGEFVEPNVRKLQWRDWAFPDRSRDGSSNARSIYTYGDGYSGAGGMTAGAAAAGLNVKWGF